MRQKAFVTLIGAQTAQTIPFFDKRKASQVATGNRARKSHKIRLGRNLDNLIGKAAA